MRNLTVTLIIGTVFLIYGMINYYIGLRGWQSLGRYLPFGKIYWVIFWFISLSYLGGRLAERFLPVVLGRGLTVIGAYWLAAMYYFLLAIILVDLVRLLDKWLKFIPEAVKAHSGAPAITGLVCLTLVACIVAFGSWNARHPQINNYNLTIDKKAGSLKELHIVMVSDIHLGTIIDNRRLKKMVESVNSLEPDIVLLAGDVVDEDVEIFIEQKMADTLKELKTKLGTYAVLGNHEYIGGHTDEAIRYLQEAGVKVLRDQYVKISDEFYVVGRDDRSGERFKGAKRQELSALMTDIDKYLPIILMDHQPSNLDESWQNGVDLQLSGHTHRGQLFPNHLITKRIFEIDWGYLRKDNFQIIVSSGFGTWGPPIRVGNTPEIVDIQLRFGEPVASD